MLKKYLVSEDVYSGQVVIECETEEVMVNVAKYTEAQLSAAMYLYRELPEKLEPRTKYTIRSYYHYELGRNAYIPESDGCTNMLHCEVFWDKDEANEYFLAEVNYLK